MGKALGNQVFITSRVQWICADLNSWVNSSIGQGDKAEEWEHNGCNLKQTINCAMSPMLPLWAVSAPPGQITDFTWQRQQVHTSFLNLITSCSIQLPGTTALWGKSSIMWGRTKKPNSLLKWEMAQVRSTVKHLCLHETQGTGVLTVQLSETRQGLEEAAVEAS